MPIELSVWRIDSGLQKVVFTPLSSEMRLEDVLAADLSILDSALMLLGRQVPTSFGTLVDLLAINAQGDLAIVELKRSRTPREVVAQALDYASWAEGLSYDQIAAIFSEHHPGTPFEEAFSERFGAAPPETINATHRLVIVAAELDAATERIINYLSSGYGVPINAVFFRHFQEGGAEYLTRTWLIDPQEVEAKASSAGAERRGREPWNGRDFYASFGEDSRRSWEDARQYGFISAGGGKWYSGTLYQLTVGARVFVCIPKVGYVGVGLIRESVVPVAQFTVQQDGRTLPILEAPLRATRMGDGATVPDLSEYVVRVEWIKTLPVSQAIWEKGMFANQNSACKLRNKFTLERLVPAFGLDD